MIGLIPLKTNIPGENKTQNGHKKVLSCLFSGFVLSTLSYIVLVVVVFFFSLFFLSYRWCRDDGVF